MVKDWVRMLRVEVTGGIEVGAGGIGVGDCVAAMLHPANKAVTRLMPNIGLNKVLYFIIIFFQTEFSRRRKY